MAHDPHRDRIIQEVCSIVALAYRSLGDYSHASDGFCQHCQAQHPGWTFQHDGRTLDYVRLAVVEKLRRDGVEIAPGFDPLTGKEK